MPEENDKTFDLTHPGRVSPQASSRPVIVGHHPVMADPMLRPMQHAQPTPTPPPQNPYPPAGPVNVPQPPVPPQPAPAPFEPIGTLPEQPPAAGPGPQPVPLAAQPPHMAHHELPISNHKAKGFGPKRFFLWVILPLVVLVVGFYLLIDSGVINSSVNLPFHVFKQKTVVVTKKSTSSTTPPAAKAAVPTGFSAYDDSALPFTFNYPTLWGTPTVTTEQGYTQRGGSNKSSGTYAYLVNFATNKDVQIAVTSSKYLPPARGTLYYDFLNWCFQTEKYYKSVLTFTTANGIDTPASVTCNNGPLTDVTVVDGSTIVQRNTKATDGATLGDIYTKNLTSTDIPVVRIKDATGKNGDNIKIILNTNQATP